jgi:hypothetical protein
MTATEFEQYVEQLVQQLDFAPGTEITRDAVLAGVRQPGRYQIDVVVRARLAGTIDFLMIIECKNWSRPIDRPIVQKVIQTRDAVAAHKAAVVSPVGFSAEAVDVARVNGVALWVLSRARWSIVMGVTGPSAAASRPYEDRRAFLDRLGFSADSGVRRRGPSLIAADDARAVPGSTAWPGTFAHEAWGGSGVTAGDDEPGIDPRLAVSVIADDCARLLGVPVVPGCRSAAHAPEAG